MLGGTSAKSIKLHGGVPGIFPDYTAPVVRNAPDGVRELAMARWGMPGPPQFGGAPITNIRNTKSSHSDVGSGRKSVFYASLGAPAILFELKAAQVTRFSILPFQSRLAAARSSGQKCLAPKRIGEAQSR